MNWILEIRNLEKSYKDKKAVNNISFKVKEGEIFCFLGPNGAGKSTTINILSSILSFSKGSISFLGEDIIKNLKDYKRNLGVVPQDLAIYENISAEKNVEFFAGLYGLSGRDLKAGVTRALEFVGLKEKRKEKASTFSGGMKRRLNIACAIAHNPKLIIMDEPTVGIDPQSRNHILESIKKLKNTGATIIYTTHYMEEVEEISDYILIIDHGEIIAKGTKEELKKSIENEKIYYVETENINRFEPKEMFSIEGIKKVEVEATTIKIATVKGVEVMDKIISLLVSKGIAIGNFTTETPSLETVFLKLTGRRLRE